MPLRILILTPEFMPVYGGVGNYVLQIARNMPPDVSVKIVTPRHTLGTENASTANDASDLKLPSNVEVAYLGSATDTFFHNFSFQLNCSRFVPELVRKGEVDLVHSQSAMPDFLISPKRLGAPIVTTMHTTVEGHSQALRETSSGFEQLSLSEKFVLLFGPVLGLLEDRYYTNKRNYITVSRWAKETMTKSLGIDADLIRVINIGVDPSVYNPGKKLAAESRFPQLADISCPKVLYLSRMATRKGINVLLAAAKKVLDKTDAHFVFAGAGKRPEIDLPVGAYTYLGYVPRDVPPLLYALNDVFVLPSFYENFPACILEAMASKCAVISTTVGGIPEMIQDGVNGSLVPPNDVDSLTESLLRIVDDDAARRSHGQKGMEYAVKNYSWPDAAMKTKAYYEEILDKHRAGRRKGG